MWPISLRIFCALCSRSIRKRNWAQSCFSCRTLPKSLRSAFEFRHASWFSEEVYAALRSANAALCNAESEKLETPDVQTADFSYLRLRKEEYSAKERTALEGRIARLGGSGDTYIYFKHEDTPEGALHAETVLSAAK